jgi:hypothetical protein
VSKQEEDIRIGKKAESLIANEAFSTALLKMENDAVWSWKDTKPDDTVKREHAWHMLRAIDNFRTEMSKLMDNGKVAQRQVEREQRSLV